MISNNGSAIPEEHNRRAIFVSSHHANLKTEHFLKSVRTFQDFVTTFDLDEVSRNWQLTTAETAARMHEVTELLTFNRELLAEAEELMHELSAALLLLSDRVTGLEGESNDNGNVVDLARWRIMRLHSQIKIASTLDRVEALGDMISQIGDQISLKTRRLVALVVA
ncbi:hypothetical protein [Dongia sp.]|uniref:hypothetical protein n=1 Tax=Dongia sp. TaxID=1977262 RepID=UPI0035AF84AA